MADVSQWCEERDAVVWSVCVWCVWCVWFVCVCEWNVPVCTDDVVCVAKLLMLSWVWPF